MAEALLKSLEPDPRQQPHLRHRIHVDNGRILRYVSGPIDASDVIRPRRVEVSHRINDALGRHPSRRRSGRLRQPNGTAPFSTSDESESSGSTSDSSSDPIEEASQKAQKRKQKGKLKSGTARSKDQKRASGHESEAVGPASTEERPNRNTKKTERGTKGDYKSKEPHPGGGDPAS